MKQLNAQQSKLSIDRMMKERKRLSKNDFVPGNLLIYGYNAKDQTVIFDRRPMVLVLKDTKRHMLGLNFHWIPFSMRMWLVRYIYKQNKENIKKGGNIDFPYKKIRPLLKKMKYAPCIRLYIKQRISRKGVVLQPTRLIEAAQLRMEMFTGVPEEVLWNKINKAKA